MNCCNECVCMHNGVDHCSVPDCLCRRSKCCELCNTHYLHEREHCFEGNCPCHSISPAKDQQVTNRPEECYCSEGCGYTCGVCTLKENKPTESVSGEGFKIVPSGRIDYCGDCDKDHGYDCPKDQPQQNI